MSEDDIQALSREFFVECDSTGLILSWDQRAATALALGPGTTLRKLAALGTEGKVERMLAEARAGERGPWEVVLCIHDRPKAFTLRAARRPDDRIAIVGSAMPDDYHEALVQVSASLSEMAALHRESDRQQRELLHRHEQLVRMHRELEEASRGVVALHAEIGEKDDSLRRAAEVKTRLVANVSHEFRTPLNSILGLTKLLLSRSDGELSEEQEKQLQFVKSSAEALSELVNDLLDLSKMEAGKVALRTSEFTVQSLFSAMRGMLKPLVTSPDVKLVIVDPPASLPPLETDEGKIGQIFRNLVSNALKFTPSGEVRIWAEEVRPGVVAFHVRDTGIGIEKEHRELIFDEFFQIDSPLQRSVKGTGLGLPLARQLAERLGGTLTVDSEVGVGSTFSVVIPARHPEVDELAAMKARAAAPAPGQQAVLVVEDDRQTLFLYEKYLRGSGFRVIPARSIDEARAALQKVQPAAIVLDIMLDGEASWSFLHDLKNNERTRDIPALVVTVTNREDKARALGADEFYMKPLDRDWLINKLRNLRRGVRTVLVIDDDHVARYLVRKHLEGEPYTVLEADGGVEGVRVARERLPDVIFLDFVMPDMGAFDVIDELKKDPLTRGIPIIIHTSKNLAEEERRRLEAEASAILSKQSLSREIAIGRIREALNHAIKTPETEVRLDGR